ncbi:MAG: transcription termination/antitermination protein NusA [Patescibacteria group bacterium]
MINIKQVQNFLQQIAEIHNLSLETVEEVFLNALASAYRRDNNLKDSVIKAKKTPTGEIKFYLVKTVVCPEELQEVKFDSQKHIMLEEAQKINPNVKCGEEIFFDLPPIESFSRIAAQVAKQVVIQKIREAEKMTLYDEFKNKEGKIVSGTIEKKDPQGNILVNLGKILGIMYKNETIPGENYRNGQKMRFYVYAVENTPQGVKIFLSRAHPFFIPAIFTFEVPEIAEGIVEIKGVAREPGVRTKMAVYSNSPNIDPVGVCIGARGARIISIMNELNNEKIDIIPWDEEPTKYVANALLPAKVIEVRQMLKRTMLVLVDEANLPLAIGTKGQNIKLAAKLTGWKIEVRLANKPEEFIEGGTAEPETKQ